MDAVSVGYLVLVLARGGAQYVAQEEVSSDMRCARCEFKRHGPSWPPWAIETYHISTHIFLEMEMEM
jgi:hypothetical protein